MARQLRRLSETGIYHIINRGADHQVVFRTHQDRLDFGRCLVRIHEELGVVVLAYCLMGNHFHLVIWAPPGTLSEAMKYLGQVFTQSSNRREDRDGAVFRGRFRSIPVETDAYLLALVRYVHRNPLDITGVDHPARYRWSSYASYTGDRPVPVFLDVDPVIGLYGGDLAELRAHTEGVPGQRLRKRNYGVDDVRQLIDGARAIEEMAHPDRALGPRIGRTIMYLLADRSGDGDLRAALIDELDPPTAKARTRAVTAAHVRLAADPAIARILAWVEEALAA